MAAIGWLPGPDAPIPEPAPVPAVRIAALPPVPGEPARLRLDLSARTGTTVPGLRLLPAASFLFWEVPRPEGEGEGAGGGPGGLGGQEREEREPDLRLRLLARLQPPLGLCLDPDGVVDWPHDLMPFQVQGIRLLHDRDRLLLADEMGLGKTVQALAALRLLALRQEVASCLVVTPAGVLSQWRDQFAAWAPELRLSPVRGTPAERDAQWRTPAHAHLVGYETLRADLALARRRVWDLVVVDEAQRIKNADSELAVAVKSLPRRRAWALTGTPLENRIEDLASILEFLRPRLDDGEPAAVERTPAVRATLAGVLLRRRKAEVLEELPPKMEAELRLPMPAEQREAYERAEREGLFQLRRQGPAIRVANVLELILRLKQICNFDPATGASAKMRDLERRIRVLSDSGERALVFSQFVDDVHGAEAIARGLDSHQPLLITGRHSLPERERTLRRFETDSRHRVLVLSLRAAGLGLNLQAASYVFHFDRWWNPAVEDQASDRSHRMGQTRPVNVYAYTLEDTVEQRIAEILAEKRLLFEHVVEGTGIHVGTALTRDELLRAVGLGSRI